MALTDKLTAIGDAIRQKSGTTDLIALKDMPSRIIGLPTGGGDTENDAVRQSIVDFFACTSDGSSEALQTFTLPKEATRIPQYGFYYRIALNDFKIETNYAPLKLIDEFAFAYCSNLKSFPFQAPLETINANGFRDCYVLDVEEFPSSLHTIGGSAFRNCYALTLSKGYPASVTAVGNNTFQNCKALAITSLPEGVTSVGNYAFSSACNSDTTRDIFTFPSTITSIGNQAFAYQNFKKYRFLGTPTSIHNSAFSYSQAITDIYVPWGQNAVANAPWGATNATIHYNTAPDEVIT